LKGEVVSLTDYGAFIELEAGIEGLVHVSEMSWTKRVKHPSKIVAVGDSIEALVLDVNERDRKISLGMKQIEENPWTVMETQYPVGSMVTGEVRNITNFGIFVGLEEGIDGLVHISDVSWTEQIKHPSDRFEKGDEVKAVVLKIDKENEKFSLGIKQLEPNPWDDIAKKYKVGSEVTGPVTNVTEFGVFVKLEDGIDGLVYSSELGAEKIENPEEHFKVGDDVKSVIVKVDPIEQKISLSIRALTDKTERAALKKVAEQESSSQATTFGDLLKEKMAEKEDASPLDDE
jgi:small subunit ribosomal protein S1